MLEGKRIGLLFEGVEERFVVHCCFAYTPCSVFQERVRRRDQKIRVIGNLGAFRTIAKFDSQYLPVV